MALNLDALDLDAVTARLARNAGNLVKDYAIIVAKQLGIPSKEIEQFVDRAAQSAALMVSLDKRQREKGRRIMDRLEATAGTWAAAFGRGGAVATRVKAGQALGSLLGILKQIGTVVASVVGL